MTHHWDYGPNKTKSERRERKRNKDRERMSSGKKIKLLNRLAMERAQRAQQRHDEGK